MNVAKLQHDEKYRGAEVILVHGLWIGAWEFGLLRRRLRKAGFATRRFSYKSTTEKLDTRARELHEFALAAKAGPLHFIGHSLGGLVILSMLSQFSDLQPGRVVLLGSPLGGSAAARKVRRLPGSNRLFGAIRPALEKGHDAMPGGREIGMIAGSRRIGLGRLSGGVDSPSDGTVSVHETRVQGLSDHRVLPVTHTGLVLSKKVAALAIRFLECGSFGADIPEV